MYIFTHAIVTRTYTEPHTHTVREKKCRLGKQEAAMKTEHFLKFEETMKAPALISTHFSGPKKTKMQCLL